MDFQKILFSRKLVISILGDVNQNKTVKIFNDVYSLFKNKSNKSIKLYIQKKQNISLKSEKVYFI